MSMSTSEKARGHLKHAHRCSCGMVLHGNGASWSHENSHTLRGEWHHALTPRQRELEPTRGFRWLSRTQWEESPGGLLQLAERARYTAGHAALSMARLVDDGQAPESPRVQQEVQLFEEQCTEAARLERVAIERGAFVLDADPAKTLPREVFASEWLARKLQPKRFPKPVRQR